MPSRVHRRKVGIQVVAGIADDSPLTAVILAAGVGSRMGSFTAERPKCLLEVAPDQTVLGLQLDRLFETGRVGQVVVVAGYRAEAVEAFVRGRGDAGRVEVLFNPFYRVANNLHSLWLARRFLAKGGLILNGDDLLSPGLIDRVLDSPGDLVVTTNTKSAYDADDMKVRRRGRLLRRIGKDIPEDVADGEAIGVIRLTSRGALWLTAALDETVRAGELNVFYLRAVQRVIDRGYPVRAADITPCPWAEIDEPRDLMRARDLAAAFVPAALPEPGVQVA